MSHFNFVDIVDKQSLLNRWDEQLCNINLVSNFSEVAAANFWRSYSRNRKQKCIVDGFLGTMYVT